MAMADKLHEAGIRIAPVRFMAYMAGATFAIAILFPMGAGIVGKFPTGATFLLVLMFAAGIGIAAPMFYVNMRAAKRMKKFEEQFPVALDVFVRGLRAGHPVQSALGLLTTEMPDPIGSEFGMVTDEVNYGLTLRQALENLADRIRTQDVQMFVVCVGIQSETGGNLAEILEGLSGVIRERASMVLKVRALSSEGKMSGIMLSILPVFSFCLVFFNSPSFYLDAAKDPIFFPAMIGSILWYITGVSAMKIMTNLKV
jgi:tight adherence protein B